MCIRDRALADRYRAVSVGERLAVWRDKPVSLHLTHCLQHALTSDPSCLNLAGNHFGAFFCTRGFLMTIHANFGSFFDDKFGDGYIGRWQLLPTKNAAA